MIYLTGQQVRQIDRRSMEEFGIPGIVLMENASRAVADAASRMLGKAASPRVLILCGGGNNGGDGLAAARHLHNRGIDVLIATYSDPARYAGDALINWRIATAMNLPHTPLVPEVIDGSFALIIDAIFGTGLNRPPAEPFSAIVDAVARSGVRVLAVDVPSGMDCDTGNALGAAIIANTTVTFVARKAGFANRASHKYTGRVIVADIGCPRELIASK